MTTTSVAAPQRAAQYHFSNSKNPDCDRAKALAALPWQWQRGLLAIGPNKRPIDPRSGRQLHNWPSAPVPTAFQLLAAPAVGLRTGPISSTMALDFDGESAWEEFRNIFGGTAEQLLPKTISWTSGKPYRCQLAFWIDPKNNHLLSNKRRKIGALELRWGGAQSVIMGAHPECKYYGWLNECAPWEIELAEFPIELLSLVPTLEASQHQAKRQVPRQVRTTFQAGLVVSLLEFVSFKNRLLIQQGSQAGECNNDAIGLSLDLIGAEAWLATQGVTVEQTAEELFIEYCNQCPKTINGRAFDYQAMQRRFDGALKRCPCPQTPESKLFERLDFHRRAANRIARQGVAA